MYFHLGCPRIFPNVPGCPRMSTDFPDAPDVPRCSRMSPIVLGCPRIFPNVPRCPRISSPVSLDVPEFPRVFQDVPRYSRMFPDVPDVLECPRCSRMCSDDPTPADDILAQCPSRPPYPLTRKTIPSASDRPTDVVGNVSVSVSANLRPRRSRCT